MTRFLLDTTFIIDVLNNQRKRLAIMKDFIAQQHELACCAINVAEVYAGMREPETQRAEALLRSLEYVPIRGKHRGSRAIYDKNGRARERPFYLRT